jgi:serine/threonine-protein kinase
MASSEMPKETPRELFGYQVIRHLADGAAAHIYEVRDLKSGERFALKHVKRENDKDKRFIEQLFNEFEVHKKINHGNVRQAITVKTSRSLLLQVMEAGLVMELLEAEPLDEAIVRMLPEGSGELRAAPLQWVLNVLVQAARGMAAINNAGFVHCDMKPGNIMVPLDGRVSGVKVIDLGQACPSGTIKKRVQGSPLYIAPEQVKLAEVTYATDVFNFGATMYWALTGKNVPTAYTKAKGITKSGTAEKAELPMELREDIGRDLNDLVMDCVKTSPRERPETMVAVVNRLGLILRSAAAA